MSATYGRLQGNRGEATRCGSKESGIFTSAETWNGSVTTHVDHDGGYIVSVGAKWGGPTVLHGNCDKRTYGLAGPAADELAHRVAEALEAALPDGKVIGEEERRIIRQALADIPAEEPVDA